MSVTWVTIADMRALDSNINFNKRQGVINNLSSSWIENTLDPPYIEAIAGYFTVKVMNRTTAMASKPSK